jgi:dTDP-4-dehydrorhamnose reductase
MRILVTGARGMLGRDLCPHLREQKHEVIEWDLPDHDITVVASTISEVTKMKPNAIFHLAAYTDVDGSEKNRPEAYKVNTLGAWTVALAARDSKADLIYVSTDYVFDGVKQAPYIENDQTRPLNYYGATKLLGEQAILRDARKHFICRTSWLFGAHGRNFVDTILRLAKEKDAIDVVEDQRGSPTYTRDLAGALALLPGSKQYGIYHVSNSGTCTWFEFAREIIRMAGLKTVVKPTTSDKYVRPARRPGYSVLDNGLFEIRFKHHLRPWQEALRDFLKQRGALKE